jgi:hypothetical protein
MSQIKNGVTNNLVPTEFYLSQNYPNPFKEKTTIKYCVPYKTKVRLAVCNSEGELVEELVNEEKKAGTYEVEFSTCHSRESLQESKAGGNQKERTYYFSLAAGDYKNEKKMTLSKESHI